MTYLCAKLIADEESIFDLDHTNDVVVHQRLSRGRRSTSRSIIGRLRRNRHHLLLLACH